MTTQKILFFQGEENKVNILFFIPHFKFWNQALVLSSLIEHLKNNNKIFVLGCDKVLAEHCMVFNAVGLPILDKKKDKQKTCSRCISYKNIFQNKNPDIAFDNLGDYLSNEDYQDIEKKIKTINKNNYKNFTIENINIGQIATHDVILIQKLNSIESLEKYFWPEYLSVVKSCLITLYSLRKYLKLIKIERVINFNNLYSSNRVVAKYTESKKIFNYNVSTSFSIANKSLQLLKINSGITSGMNYSALKFWNKNSNFQLNDYCQDLILSHFDSIFKSEHYLNYSKPLGKMNLKKYINKKYKKTILVGLSGADEDVCLIESGLDITYSEEYSSIFKDQFDWLLKLINFIKSDNENLYIIRPHPRDWPDAKRPFVTSDNYKKFKSILTDDLPDNIVVNDPSENISVYDFIKICDVLLVSRSSIAVDFGILGIPVITSDLSTHMHPVEEFYKFRTEDEYFSLLKKIFSFRKSYKTSEFYLRWFVCSNIFDCLDISNSLDKNENKNITNTVRKVIVKILETFNIFIHKKFDIYSIKKNEFIKNKINKQLINKYDSVINSHQFENYDYEKNILITKKIVNKIKRKYKII